MVSPISPYANLVTRNIVLHFTLLRGESIGLALDTEAGLLSTIASFVILMLISVSLGYLWIIFLPLKLSLAPNIHGSAVGSDGYLCGRYQNR
jgi:hypothetical protein